MKTPFRLIATKWISDLVAFFNTKIGLVTLIFIAIVPESSSIMMLFTSLFEMRLGEGFNYGWLIGTFASMLIYLVGSFGMAVIGYRFASFLSTLFGSGLALLNWMKVYNISFQNVMQFDFVIVGSFVLINFLLLAILCDFFSVRNKDAIAYMRSEEKQLDDQLKGLRENEFHTMKNGYLEKLKNPVKKKRKRKDNVVQFDLDIEKTGTN